MNHAQKDQELARLEALREYQILDTEAEGAFDDLVQLTANILGVPTALVSLVDAERQWFKAKVGSDLCETSREVSFCAHAIEGRTPLIVPDARLDPRFSENPLVTGPECIRFYAGVPLVTGEGFALGTLCAIDTTPREITSPQLEALEVLARQVMAQLDLHKTNRSLGSTLKEVKRAQSDANRRQASLAAIDEIARMVASELDYEKVTHGIVEAAAKVCGTSRACLWSSDPKGSASIQKCVYGPSWIDYLEAEPKTVSDFASKSSKVVTANGSYLSSPIVAFGKAVGRIAIHVDHPTALTAGHTEALEHIAAQTAVAMRNATIFHQMESENLRRRDAIEEGQRSLQYTDDILSSLTSILIVIGSDGKIERWNNASTLAFGLDGKKALGKTLETLPIGWNIEPVIAGMKTLRVGDDPLRMDDLHIEQVSGKPRIFGLSLRKLTVGEDNVSLILGADITARRLAEESVRQQDHRYRQLVDNVADVIFNVDSSGCFLFLNQAWENLTGYSVEETLSRSLFDFVDVEDRAALFQQQILRESSDDVDSNAKFRLKHKSGEVRWVEAHVHRQRDAQGRVFGSTGTLQDVTDRHRAIMSEAEQVKVASFLTSLSTQFINLRPEEMDDAVNAALESTAEYLHLDRSVVCVFSEDRLSYCIAQGWSNNSFDFESEVRIWHPVSEIPMISEGMERGETIILDDFQSLGSEWEAEKAHAKEIEVQASVFIPLSSRGLLLGFAKFSRRNPTKKWSKRTVSLLKIVATVFANTLLRFRTDAEVEWLSALALAESENLLRSVVTSAPIGLQAVDRFGTVTLCEGRGLDALGLTADLALGANIVDLYRELPQLLRHFVRARSGETFTVEEELGDTALELHFSPMLSQEGAYSGTIAVAIDVTQRVQADAAARIRDRAIAASSNGITICDATQNDFPIIYANAKFLELTGYNLEDVIGRNCRFLQGEDGDQEALIALRSAVKNGQECRTRLRNYRKDGTMFWNDLAVYPVRDAYGKVTHYVGEQNDITVRVELESQLHRAQKMESIGQLAAGIAHEINTPIQYVGGNLRFVLDSHNDFLQLYAAWERLLEVSENNPELATLVEAVNEASEKIEMPYLLEEVPKALTQSLDGVNRVVEIVQSMKVFSHPGATEKEPTDLNRGIESTINVCRNEWRYVAQVVTNLDRNLSLVECHPGEINQTILNLIVNAAHAIGDARKEGDDLGTITVSTRHNGLYVEIEVSDTGPGIPKHAQSKIFDPFFTTKEVGRGTGQGLSIAHSVIVDHHSGSLDFQTSDRGTTFTIKIPISATNRTALAA